MGLSFSKSIRFGPIRFNFSGAGIGMSVGVPGLRIGTGPRGAYISGGAAGFRYRQSLGGKQHPHQISATAPVRISRGSDAVAPIDPNIVDTVDHETKNVLELRDSTSDALLQSINEQRHKMDLWPIALAVFGTLFFLLRSIGATWPQGMHLSVFVAFAVVVLWVCWRDKLRKLTVLFYEPDAATNELYFFLNVLMFEAKALGLAPKALTLNQTPEGFGVAEETLPFAGANVSERVGMLRNKQVECARRHKAGDQAGYRLLSRDLYNDLRMAWERGVEEVLLNEVVLRFRKGVETSRLKKVAVDTDLVNAVTAGMSKCSNYTGHDSAQEANVAPPLPEEMDADINALEAWRKSVVDRREKKQ